MGVRYFCDRCEKEFKSDGLAIETYARDALGMKLFYMGVGLLCGGCAKKFNMVKDSLEYEEDFFTMKDDEINKILTPIPTSDSLIIGFDNSSTDSACLTVAKNDGKYIKITNAFYGEDALKEYKKLVGIRTKSEV